MRKILLILVLIPLLIPLSPAEASLVPCGQNTDDPTTTINETDKCNLCYIVSGVSSLITYARDIMTFIALVVLVGMGILYIVSAGNEGMMTTAKGGIKAALVGFTVILLAWIIVNTVLFGIFQSKSDLGVKASFTLTNGFSFNCDAKLNDAPINATVTSGTIPLSSIPNLPSGAVVGPLSCSGGVCTASVTNGGAVIGTVTGTQSGTDFTGTYTASVQGTAPSSCSVVAVPTVPVTNGSVVLTANCTTGTTPFTYVWSSATGCENGTAGKTCVKNKLTAGSHAYSVAVSNGTLPNATVSGSFNAGASYKLSVTNTSSNGGSGLVTSTNFPGISCGDDCEENFLPNNSVMLKAEPSTGASFSGWSGACSGSNVVCAVNMNAVRNVTATFSKTTQTTSNLLNVEKKGSGSGTVSSSVGISCGSDCSESVSNPTWAYLYAVPSGSSTFSNWTGCDSLFSAYASNDGCSVLVQGSKTVTVYFTDNSTQAGKFWVSPESILHKPGVSDSTTTFSYNVSGGPPNGVLRWGSSTGMIIGTLDTSGNFMSTGWWYPSGCAGSGSPGFVITHNAYIDGIYFGTDTLRCEAP